jgi:hypothetical protein
LAQLLKTYGWDLSSVSLDDFCDESYNTGLAHEIDTRIGNGLHAIDRIASHIGHDEIGTAFAPTASAIKKLVYPTAKQKFIGDGILEDVKR